MIEKVYVPGYCLKKGWFVQEVESIYARYHKTPGYSAILQYRGFDFNGDNIFTERVGAELWIAKEYSKAEKYRYNGMLPGFGCFGKIRVQVA